MSQRAGGDLQAEPTVPKSLAGRQTGDTDAPLASFVPKEQAGETPQIRGGLGSPKSPSSLLARGGRRNGSGDNLGMPTRPPDSLT